MRVAWTDYESLHETPLIANTIARMKLHEMNSVISDTAEYGCYLYTQACVPLLKDFMTKVDVDVVGTKFNTGCNTVDNRALNAVNAQVDGPAARTFLPSFRPLLRAIRSALHPVNTPSEYIHLSQLTALPSSSLPLVHPTRPARSSSSHPWSPAPRPPPPISAARSGRTRSRLSAPSCGAT